MGMSAGDAFAIVAVATLLLLAIPVLMVVAMVRGARRLRRSAADRARRAGVASRGSTTAPLDRSAVAAAAASTLGSPTWWITHSDRHRMWRAVSAAAHAVETARRADAPVGDLPTLVAELSTAARGADALLRASARDRSLRGRATADRRSIEGAAHDIHRVAVEALELEARVDTERVTSAVQREVAALAAGLRAARAAGQSPSR